jgi:CHASE3 domain sensor protein
MRFFGQKRIAVGFFVAVIFVLFGAIATYSTTVQFQQTSNNISHNDAIKTNLNNLLIGLLNAETGQRGFVITGNASYLAPYYTGLATIDESNDTLSNLISSGSNLSASYLQLQPLIQNKVAELNESIVLMETKGFAAAQALVETNAGNVYMNELRQIIGSMVAYVSQITSQEESLAAAQLSQRLDAAYFDAIVAAGGVGFALYAANTNFQKEQRVRREAELLRDILTHDIRNFNQVSRMSADILSEMFNNDPEAAKMIAALSNSIDGSTQLVDRAKKLGKVLSEGKVKLYPVELMKSIDDSMNLAKDSTKNLGKTVLDELKVVDQNEKKILKVMGDELIDEVFVNLYVNSIKYSDGQKVVIQTNIQSSEDGHFWMVSVTDFGRGIPDDQKKVLFQRYHQTSTGRGLGMSIVHALVVERYRGKIEVKDRVPGDYTQGTTINLWLIKATETT